MKRINPLDTSSKSTRRTSIRFLAGAVMLFSLFMVAPAVYVASARTVEANSPTPTPTSVQGVGTIKTTATPTPTVPPVTPTVTVTPVKPTPTVVTPTPTATSIPTPTPTKPVRTPVVTRTPIPHPPHHHHPPKTHPGGTSHGGGGGSHPTQPSTGSTGSSNGTSGSQATPPSVGLPSVADLQAEGRLPGNGDIPANVRRWAYLILPAAHKYDIPPAMIAAVMTAESEGDPLALSGSNARGLMQVLAGPWDPQANINLGVSMLAGYYQEFGTWKLALAAYNAGPGAVIHYGGVPPFKETEDYVVIVSYLYDEYSQHGLSGSAKSSYQRSLHDFHSRHHVKYLKPGKAGPQANRHYAKGNGPGQLAIPDGCDPSGGCNKPATLMPSPPVADPLWPLGGSIDPLGVVSPNG